MPPGPNQSTPLVHDGVIFVHSYGEHLQALDAETGDELWRYSWELPRGHATRVHRNIALYEDKVYFTTSDAHVVALHSRTGTVAWEQDIGDPIRKVVNASGGPLIAQNVVMQGVNAGVSLGGGYVVGLDAATGRLLWRFNTVAQPGEANGDSWNGLPAEKRAGGSVWTAGSYDSKRRLAFFGPAPTYHTEPLRQKVQRPGITNDALYTDSTIALDPKSGKLEWYYQHLRNDQWDLDWAFERHIVALHVDGKLRRLVVTAGKQAIYDALDAESGQHVFSIDLGLQNLVTSIDPKTGAKTVDPTLLPGNSETVTVCPHLAGAKSWLPASYDPNSHVLYIPLVESCMDLIPARKGWYAGVRLRPRAGSDGKYGRLHAIDLEKRQTIWVNRQRAPQTTGALATAGGLVFAGALDRFFTAYDAHTGATLWDTRLSDTPNAAPISYLVKGKQYIAVVVGGGHGQTETFLPLVPEIRPPIAKSSALWVFALRE